MRSRYLVTYDVTADDRRSKVFKVLRGYGEHLQFSVFRCDLNDVDRARLVADLHPLLDHHEDQILLAELGPVDGRGNTCVTALGRAYRPVERTVVVI